MRNRTTTYGYDGAGNLSWDQANRMTGYGASATYAYNGDGLRMSKTVSGITTQQTWEVAEGLPLLVQDGTAKYVTGPGGLALEQVNGDGTVNYFHADQLGSTRALTNSTGSVVDTWTYDPYGNISASTGTVPNPFQFSGQCFDSESGLVYLRARYYDPATAQFISRDPAMAVTRQRFAYVGDSPLNYTDPLGLWNWGALPGALSQSSRSIGDVAATVSTVTAIAALVSLAIPGVGEVAAPILGGISLASGAVALTAHVIAAANGAEDQLDIGLDAAGLLVSGAGIGLARLGLRAGVLNSRTASLYRDVFYGLRGVALGSPDLIGRVCNVIGEKDWRPYVEAS